MRGTRNVQFSIWMKGATHIRFSVQMKGVRHVRFSVRMKARKAQQKMVSERYWVIILLDSKVNGFVHKHTYSL